jgi:hypothetical protein
MRDAPVKAVWTSQAVALGNGSSASLILNAIQPATMPAEEAAVCFQVLLRVTRIHSFLLIDSIYLLSNRRSRRGNHWIGAAVNRPVASDAAHAMGHGRCRHAGPWSVLYAAADEYVEGQRT